MKNKISPKELTYVSPDIETAEIALELSVLSTASATPGGLGNMPTEFW